MRLVLQILASVILVATPAFAESGEAQSLERSLARHEKFLADDHTALAKEKAAHNEHAIAAREKSIRNEDDKIAEIKKLIKKKK